LIGLAVQRRKVKLVNTPADDDWHCIAEELSTRLQQALKEHPDQILGATLSAMCMGYASAQIPCAYFLNAPLSDLRGKFKSCDLREITNTLWGLSQLRVPPKVFYLAVESVVDRHEEMLSCITGKGYDFSDAVQIIWSIACFGELPDDSSRIVSFIHSWWGRTMNWASKAEVLSAGDRDRVTGGCSLLSIRSQLQQIWVWSRYVARDFLVSPLGPQMPKNDWADALTSKGVRHSNFQASVFDCLKRVGLGTDEYPIDEEFNIDSTGIVVDLAQVETKIAIECDGPHHYLTDRTLIGRSAFKHRVVRALGWKLIAVPYFEWVKLGFENGRNGCAQMQDAYMRMRIGKMEEPCDERTVAQPPPPTDRRAFDAAMARFMKEQDDVLELSRKPHKRSRGGAHDACGVFTVDHGESDDKAEPKKPRVESVLSMNDGPSEGELTHNRTRVLTQFLAYEVTKLLEAQPHNQMLSGSCCEQLYSKFPEIRDRVRAAKVSIYALVKDGKLPGIRLDPSAKAETFELFTNEAKLSNANALQRSQGYTHSHPSEKRLGPYCITCAVVRSAVSELPSTRSEAAASVVSRDRCIPLDLRCGGATQLRRSAFSPVGSCWCCRRTRSWRKASSRPPRRDPVDVHLHSLGGGLSPTPWRSRVAGVWILGGSPDHHGSMMIAALWRFILQAVAQGVQEALLCA
jgi:hypothetical protein